MKGENAKNWEEKNPMSALFCSPQARGIPKPKPVTDESLPLSTSFITFFFLPLEIAAQLNSLPC